MKNYFSSTIFFLSLLQFVTYSSQAQEECEIYNKVIDSVYKLTSKARVAINEKYPVDPTKRDTTDLTYEVQDFPYIIYLEDQTSENWTSSGFLNRFSDLTNSLHLRKSKYRTIAFASLRSCGSIANSGCLYFINRKTPTDYEKWEKCEKSNLFTRIDVRRLSLSNIFLSTDRKIALVVLVIKDGFNMPQKWGIVAKKIGKSWTISRLERTLD